MKPSHSSPPRTATNFRTQEDTQASTSITMPDADDNDDHSGFSWSFPSTPSAHGFGATAHASGEQEPPAGLQSFDEDDVGTVRNAHGFNQHRKDSSPVPFYTPNTGFAFPRSQTASPMARKLPLASPSGLEMPLMSSPSASPPRSARGTTSAHQFAVSSQERDSPSRPGMQRLASVAVMERGGSGDHPTSSHRSRLSSGSDSSKFRTGSFLSRPGSANRIDVDRGQASFFDATSFKMPDSGSTESLRVSVVMQSFWRYDTDMQSRSLASTSHHRHG